MMMNEFEERTGIYVPTSIYAVIEQFYTDGKMDKDDFCAAYKENTDYLAMKIQRACEVQAGSEKKAHENECLALKKQITTLEKEVKSLQKQLEDEQEWRAMPLESKMSEWDYNILKTTELSEVLTAEEAIQKISDGYGFAADKILIESVIMRHQKNRHNVMRVAGSIQRQCLYASSDWNYIRFSVRGFLYEIVNGDLYMM